MNQRQEVLEERVVVLEERLGTLQEQLEALPLALTRVIEQTLLPQMLQHNQSSPFQQQQQQQTRSPSRGGSPLGHSIDAGSTTGANYLSPTQQTNEQRHTYLHPDDAQSLAARSSWSASNLTSGSGARQLLAPIVPRTGSFDA